MTMYFCITDIFDTLEKISDAEARLDQLVEVSVIPPECGGFAADVFVVPEDLKVLDFTSASAAYSLAELLEDVPLYHVNIELALDRALTERKEKKTLEGALVKAFRSDQLPMPMPGNDSGPGALAAALHHPMIGHMDMIELCKIYIAFLNAFEQIPPDYSFEKSILGKHRAAFIRHYDGYKTRYEGRIAAKTLLRHSARKDHDRNKKMENYVENGHRMSEAMKLSENWERILVWVEADQYQLRRCRDADRFLQSFPLKKNPAWLRTEMFCLLEREAIKQSMATAIKRESPNLNMLSGSPVLRRAIEASASGQVDENLQQMISQILDVEAVYSGTGKKFVAAATVRYQEARAAGLQ